MAISARKTIGSNPKNLDRMEKLHAIRRAGYRGKISVTAYFGADIYDITSDEVRYMGYYHHTKPEYMYPNFASAYHNYVVTNATA